VAVRAVAAGLAVATCLCSCGGSRTATPSTAATATDPTSSTSTPPTWGPGGRDVSEVFGGRLRHARIVVPGRPGPSGRYSVLVALHGVGGDGAQVAQDSRFDVLAGARGYVVAYPDGVGGTWNAGSCCFTAVDESVDDVGYVRRLFDEIATAVPVDPTRRYVAGFSNGGMLAYRIACEQAGLVAAVASVAGTVASHPCAPSQAVSVLEIHGDADTLVGWSLPFNGYVRGQRTRLVEDGAVATAAGWRARDGCPATSVTRLSAKVVMTAARSCRDGTAVALYHVARGGHAWPGSASAGPNQATPDATELVLEFFAAHPG
jgi:polyhydroxybutyrate depolymerase